MGPASTPFPTAPLRERRWLPVVAVGAVIAVVVTGGYLTADALGDVRDGVVSVDASVEVTPLPGWELADRFDEPPGVRLTSGSLNLDVVSIPFTESHLRLLEAFVEEVLEPDAEQFRISEEVERVRLASGQSGARIAYVGLFGDVQAPIEGEVTAVVSSSGVGVLFDGWAPAGQLQFGIEDVRAMIESAVIA